MQPPKLTIRRLIAV
ncbi:uncharacterized protein FFM5_14727 [Fusarium fujikuroi]|nr:uncharacterized protein FFM5_14727 [Fusarium fujikuroi]